jgi:D-alanyl-D-alanine dipeptidase
MKWSVPLTQKRAPVAEPIVELNRIKIQDNGEPLIDALAKLKRSEIHPDRKDYKKTAPHRYHGRASLVNMLREAEKKLPRGYRFMLWGIYRSMEEQIKIYEEVTKSFKEKNPQWPYNILRRQVNRFVHPPDIKTPPGHSTGGAVDLSLIGPDGESLNMTAPYDSQSEDRRLVAATFSPYLEEPSRKNRKILINAMNSAGFTNYGGEWWHWSYGDSCWAWRLKRKTAIYGPIDPPQK